MTIASEIQKLQTNLTNSYTAVSNKGGALPASQNFDNLPSAINSIQTGSFYAILKVITNEDATVTANGETQTATGGIAMFYIYIAGDYEIVCSKDGYTKSGTITISEATDYEITIYPKSDTPDNYQRLEYIQSNGTGFFDTQFAFTSNTAKITLECMLTQSTNGTNLFGSSTNYDSSWFGIYMQGGTQGGLYCGNSNPWSTQFQINVRRSFVFDRQGNTLYITDGSAAPISKTVGGTIICGNNVMIASQPPQGANRSPKGVRYYRFGIEQNSVAVRSFYPVYRKVDGITGLYDEVDNKFYPPAAGTFIRGPEV